MSIGDEDISIRSDQDVGRWTEGVRSVACDAGFTEGHQNFSVRAELEHLIAFGIFCRAVNQPDVSLSVHMDSMGADEHPGAKARHELARRIELEDGREI